MNSPYAQVLTIHFKEKKKKTKRKNTRYIKEVKLKGQVIKVEVDPACVKYISNVKLKVLISKIMMFKRKQEKSR